MGEVPIKVDENEYEYVIDSKGEYQYDYYVLNKETQNEDTLDQDEENSRSNKDKSNSSPREFIPNLAPESDQEYEEMINEIVEEREYGPETNPENCNTIDNIDKKEVL